ncbi:MAG: AMP-binding protein, partial [Myxococcota bacterium]|nr:AMP-binding protein [Myxococcota bacterium]
GGFAGIGPGYGAVVTIVADMDFVASSTLPGLLADWARRDPDAVALRDKQLGIWNEVTWSGYWQTVQAVARQLWELGLRSGDSVSVLSDNRPEWLYADLGAQVLGVRSAGIYQTNPPEDVAYVLSHSGSRVVFCEDQEQVDKVVAVADQTPTVEHVVVFDPRGLRGYQDPRLVSWKDFLAAGTAALKTEEGWVEPHLTGLDPDSASMIVYTSGTTGQPKGALLSPRNALSAAAVMAPLLELRRTDTVLSYLPLCHVAEKIFSAFLPLTVGGVVHFGESIETVRSDLCEVSPTVFLGVPRIWEKMHASVCLRMKDSSWLKRLLYGWATRTGQAIAQRDQAGSARWSDRAVWFVADMLVFRAIQERLGLRRCRLAVTGAAPVAPELLAWFHGMGVKILEGYGQTECAGVSHVNPPGAFRLGTVGRTIPCMEFRLAGDGEILVRGAPVFLGYLHDEEATRATVDEEGWLHTGDVGAEDEDGYLRITGRKKEIIITAGGKNLSPEKIENALKVSLYIKEAVAVGDRRKFISALVQVDREAVGDWATRRAIPFTDFADLSGNDQVVRLVEDEVRQANERLARVEQVRAFRLFRKELHQDDGELTATQKVRRGAVMELHAGLVDEIYGGGA